MFTTLQAQGMVVLRPYVCQFWWYPLEICSYGYSQPWLIAITGYRENGTFSNLTSTLGAELPAIPSAPTAGINIHSPGDGDTHRSHCTQGRVSKKKQNLNKKFCKKGFQHQFHCVDSLVLFCFYKAARLPQQQIRIPQSCHSVGSWIPQSVCCTSHCGFATACVSTGVTSVTVLAGVPRVKFCLHKGVNGSITHCIQIQVFLQIEIIHKIGFTILGQLCLTNKQNKTKSSFLFC